MLKNKITGTFTVFTLELTQSLVNIDTRKFTKKLMKEFERNTIICHFDIGWCEVINGKFASIYSHKADIDSTLIHIEDAKLDPASTWHPFTERKNVRLLGVGEFHGRAGTWYLTGLDKAPFEIDKA